MAFKGTNRTVLAIVSGLFAATAITGTGILVRPDAHSAWAGSRDTRSVCQTSVLTADDGVAGDLLGISAAIGGDYAFLGALSGDKDTVFNCGSVYVFRRDGVSWVQHQELNAWDASAFDEFGYSVSVGGDLLVVGAPKGEIPGYSDTGVVDVFRRNGQTWTQQVQLVAGHFYREQGARFGEAVALDAEPPSGARLIVGASDRTVDFKKTGEVYFFEQQGTGLWETMGFPRAATTGDNDKFGSVVSISGDWAIVGAPKTDDECPLNNTCDSGSAFVYRYTGSA
ncbi:MAG: FG-GAP repeat protein, partial [Planctomycetota bacterium]